MVILQEVLVLGTFSATIFLNTKTLNKYKHPLLEVYCIEVVIRALFASQFLNCTYVKYIRPKVLLLVHGLRF